MSKRKIKVGVYLQNRNIADVDLSKPYLGNPGIGGTQYMFVCLPYYYNLYFNDVEFIFLADEIKKLPNNYKKIKVNSLLEAAKKAKDESVDIFIYRPVETEEGWQFLDQLNSFKIKTIAWAHNTPFKQLDKIATNPWIKRYISVGVEQYDMVRDHPIIYKADVIFNIFDPSPFITNEVKKERGMVVYLGSLIPAKGFHVFAKVWRKIIKEVPYAKLMVIGSGKLYNRNAKLGKWGISEENYERILRKYLSDENENPHPSVKFMGLMGQEKISLLQKAMVGVVNPTGQTETFCISALEIQASGTPVVSGAYWGLLDTVKSGYSGFLVKTEKELAKKIVYLLKNEDIAIQMGKNAIKFVKEKFDYKKTIQGWNRIFMEIMNDIPPKIRPITQNPDFDFKTEKEFLRKLKEKYPIFSFIPPFIKLRKFYKYFIKIYLK